MPKSRRPKRSPRTRSTGKAPPQKKPDEWLDRIPEMVGGIHGGGQKVKERALAYMGKDRRLADAANIFLLLNTAIRRYLKEHKARDGDEVVALLLLLRVHNSLITSMELALQGYPQQALALQRDVFECCMLGEWFAHDRPAIRRWATSDSWERMNGEFKQKTLRVELDRLAGIKKDEVSDRQRIYTYQSEAGAHFNAAGLDLVVKDGKYFFGPIFNAGLLTEASEQSNVMAWRMATLLLPLFPKAAEGLRAWATRCLQHVDRLLDQYAEKYRKA